MKVFLSFLLLSTYASAAIDPSISDGWKLFPHPGKGINVVKIRCEEKIYYAFFPTRNTGFFSSRLRENLPCYSSIDLAVKFINAKPAAAEVLAAGEYSITDNAGIVIPFSEADMKALMASSWQRKGPKN
jgi:hypothetical protein